MVGGPRHGGRGRPITRRPELAAFLLVVAAAGCELTEVTVPQGDPIMVVQSVLSRGASRQFVVVEEAFVGRDTSFGFFDSIPPGGPRFPIPNAVVALTYSDGACGPRVDTLTPLASAEGVYEVTGGCTPAPGDRVELAVRVPDGRVVTGYTMIPGARVVTVTAGTIPIVPDTPVLFNRTRDSLSVDVLPILARGMQLEVRRREPVERRLPGMQDHLVVFAITDSLGLTLPGKLINPFEGGDFDRDGQVVFRAGIEYDVTVAVADTNYYDFVRSVSDPITGRGFINRLQGGTGVFGAVEPWRYRVRVVEDFDDEREGVYRLTGALEGDTVDVTLHLYIDAIDKDVFAAFMDGTWRGQPIRRSVDGVFGSFAGIGGAPHAFQVVLQTPFPSNLPVPEWEVWTIRGTRPPRGQFFDVEVDGFDLSRRQIVEGILRMVQTTGPN